jgi:hypothetical protein
MFFSISNDIVVLNVNDAPGTYYMVVDQTGPSASSHSLSVTGTGVSGAAMGQ